MTVRCGVRDWDVSGDGIVGSYWCEGFGADFSSLLQKENG